jgi:hypothetical protein
MPPKAAKKKAPTGAAKLAAEDAAIDERLAKIDLWGESCMSQKCLSGLVSRPRAFIFAVDDMKHEVCSMMEAAVEDVRAEVRTMLLGVKPSILEMKMGDFLRDCGGSFQVAYDKERKMAKCVFMLKVYDEVFESPDTANSSLGPASFPSPLSLPSPSAGSLARTHTRHLQPVLVLVPPCCAAPLAWLALGFLYPFLLRSRLRHPRPPQRPHLFPPLCLSPAFSPTT